MIGVFVLYLIPYALIVGELGSSFKNNNGGLTSWVYQSIGPKTAYFTGWISWVVMLPYLMQRSSSLIVSFNWIINQNEDISYINIVSFQLMAIAAFLIILIVAFRGIKSVNAIANIGGTSMLIFAVLYIMAMLLVPAVGSKTAGVEYYPISFDVNNFVPSDWSFLLSLSILISGVAGVEQVSTYISDLKKPSKDFPKGILAAVIFVIFVNLLGVIACSIMFGQAGEEIGTDFLTNGQYLAFQKLGQYFGLGNSLLIIFSIVKFISEIAVTLIIIDSPIRMLIGEADKKFLPAKTLKQNKYGTYPAWLIIEGVLVTLLLLLPISGISNVDSIIQWTLEVNSICSPIINLCLFLGYIFFKARHKQIAVKKDAFVFVRGRRTGIIIGAWCFIITFVAIILQIYDADIFTFMTKAIVPLGLLALGLIVPVISKFVNKK